MFLRVSLSAMPLALMARTDTPMKGLKVVAANTPVTSVISRPKRVSGLSEPKRPMATFQGRRTKGVATTTSSSTFHSVLMSPSLMVMMSFSSTKDSSSSTCVNSG